MGSVAIVAVEGPERERRERLNRLFARSSHRGVPTGVEANGVAVGIQSTGDDAFLVEGPAFVVAFRGHIGNLLELMRQFNVPREETTSPALAIRALWEKMGEQLFGLLRGEFSMVVLDKRERSLIVATDVLGLRPLFYRLHEDELVVGAEVRQVVAGSRDVGEVEPQYYAQWLIRGLGGGELTPIKGIHRIPPGEVISFARRSGRWETRASPFWAPPPLRDERTVSFPAAVEEYRAILRRVVARAAPDQPFAVSMSGGLDSPAVWAVVRALGLSDGSEHGLGKPFSDVYPGEECDETPQIRSVLRHTHSAGVEINANELEFAEGLRELTRVTDWCAGATLFYMKALAQAMREEGRRICLLGSGGDDWLEGNLAYLAELIRKGRIVRAAVDFLRLPIPFGRSRPYQWRRRARYLAEVLGVRSVRRAPPPWLDRRWHDLLNQDENQVSNGRRLSARSCRDILADTLRFHQNGLLNAREQYAAYLGIELRHPLLDLDVVEFAFRTPPRLFVQGRRYRHLHRVAMAGLLPDDVRNNLRKPVFDSLFERETRALAALAPREADTWNLVRAGVVDRAGLDRIRDAVYSSERLSPSVVQLVIAETAITSVQKVGASC